MSNSTEKSTRCFFCKKKFVLLLNCHCNHNYCIKHRMPEDHNCSYNFKTEGRKQLSNANPKIESLKFEMI